MTENPPPTSPYYPPRADWRSGWFNAWDRARRFLARHHFVFRSFSTSLTLAQILPCLLLPGLAVIRTGRPQLGRYMMALYFFCIPVYVIALGYWISSAAMSLMIAIHTVSLLVLAGEELRQSSILWRVAGGIASTMVVYFLLYQPVFFSIHRNLWTGFRVNERVMVVSRLTPVHTIKAGDRVCYQTDRFSGHGYVFTGGENVGQVLAQPGDRIRFTPKVVLVNRMVWPRQDHMPTSGEIFVPKNHWFIWSEFSISRNSISPDEIQRIKMGRALVSREDYRGKVLRHWFGRPQ